MPPEELVPTALTPNEADDFEDILEHFFSSAKRSESKGVPGTDFSGRLIDDYEPFPRQKECILNERSHTFDVLGEGLTLSATNVLYSLIRSGRYRHP